MIATDTAVRQAALQQPAAARPEQYFDTELFWSLEGPDADLNISIRAHYLVHHNSVYDRGMGRGEVHITRVEEQDYDHNQRPFWSKTCLPDSILQKIARTIEAELNIVSDDDEA